VGRAFVSAVGLTGWPTIVAAAGMILFVYAALYWRAGMSRPERNQVAATAHRLLAARGTP
jgi:hypothetical protein